MKHVERNNPYQKKGLNCPQAKKYLFAYNKLKDSKNIVDLGCGEGYGVQIFKDSGKEITGIDYSDDAIKLAYNKYPGRYIKQDLNNISIYGFDGAVCIETLCHLDNPQDFINKLNVKKLVVSAPIDPNKNDGYVYRKHNLSEAQFKELFKDWEIKDELKQTYGATYLTLYVEKNT